MRANKKAALLSGASFAYSPHSISIVSLNSAVRSQLATPEIAVHSLHTRPRSQPPAFAFRSAPWPLLFPTPSHTIPPASSSEPGVPQRRNEHKLSPPDRPVPPARNQRLASAIRGPSAKNRRRSDSTTHGPQPAPRAADHRTRPAC